TSLRVGDASRAAELYARLLPDADRWLVFMLAGFAAEATYARYLGGFATMLRRWEDAEHHFGAALARAQAAGARPEQAKVLAAHAAMLHTRDAAGDVPRAASLAARAREIAEDLGLARVLESLPPAPPPPPLPPPASVSPP